MPRNHNLTTVALCEAIRYRATDKNCTNAGTTCGSTELVENDLCWTHRKVVEFGRATREQVMRGER